LKRNEKLKGGKSQELTNITTASKKHARKVVGLVSWLMLIERRRVDARC